MIRNVEYDESIQQILQELRGSIDTILGDETNVRITVEIGDDKHYFRIGTGQKRKRLLIIKPKLCCHFQDGFIVPEILWRQKEKIISSVVVALIVAALNKFFGRENVKDIIDNVFSIASKMESINK